MTAKSKDVFNVSQILTRTRSKSEVKNVSKPNLRKGTTAKKVGNKENYSSKAKKKIVKTQNISQNKVEEIPPKSKKILEDISDNQVEEIGIEENNKIKSKSNIVVNKASLKKKNIVDTNTNTRQNIENVKTTNEVASVKKKKDEVFLTSSQTNIPEGKPTRNLRKVNNKNYAESSIEDSLESSSISTKDNTMKQPIYLQKLTNNKNKTKNEDLYEFDESDSDKDLKKKKQNKATNIKKSGKFDKTMHSILTKLEKKEKQQKERPKKITRKPKAGFKSPKYQKIINNVVKKVASKIGNKNDLTNELVQKTQMIKDNLNNETVQEIEIQKQILEVAQSNPKTSPQENLFEVRPNSDAYRDKTPNTDKDISNEDKTTPKRDENCLQDVKSFFEFNETDSSSESEPTVKIIQNILLKEASIDSPELFDRNKPNANSTMVQLDTSSSPWRTTDVIRRNPHFLSIKKSALPSVQQEMVLDYSQIKRFEDSFSHSVSVMGEVEKTSKLKQKRIKEYFGNESEIVEEDNENTPPQCTLFDADYSPIKSSKQTGTRSVLGQKNDNALNSVNIEVNSVLTNGSPNKAPKERFPMINSPEKSPTRKITCFGFDEDESREVNKQDNGSKPYRFDVKVLEKNKDKKIVCDRNKRVCFVKKQYKGNSEQENENIINISCENGDESGENTKVDLFDDPEKEQIEKEQEISIKLPSNVYKRKATRKRCISVNSEGSEDEQPKPKKRNQMSKAEEAALENWAEKFNSMCDEVNKYELEIE